MEIWTLTLFALGEMRVFYNSYSSMYMTDDSGYKERYIAPICEEHYTVNKIGEYI